MADLNLMDETLIQGRMADLNVEDEAVVQGVPPLTIEKTDAQSEESFQEQRLALSLGVSAVNRYSKQFGVKSYAKGVLTNGAPGAGKTFVLQTQGLYGMSQGLRAMSTSLMAVRATAIGCNNLHRIFQWEVGKNANLFRLAEVSRYYDYLHSTDNWHI